MIIDANGWQIPPTSALALVIRMGKTQMPSTFFVVKHLAVPVLLGCAFARKTVRAILPMDDKMVLASDKTISSHGEHQPEDTTQGCDRLGPPIRSGHTGREQENAALLG